MAAAGFTPISLYYTTTSGAGGIPSAGNLVNGELAINITDGKLYYKDNGGTVQVIATKATGTIGGSTTQVQYNNAGVLAGSSNLTFDGTSLTLGGNPTLSAGTANGVLYLNGSKVATSGSALTFASSTLTVNNTVSASNGTNTINVDSVNQQIASFVSGVGYGTLNLNGSPLVFQITGSEQMRLTSTGLGIGTSSPAYKLDVSGTARIVNGGDTYVGFGANKDNFWTTGTTSGKQVWRNSAGTEFMTLDSSGNLGLGVTPSASTFKMLQIGSSDNVGSLTQDPNYNDFAFGSNCYLDTTWKYRKTGEGASLFRAYGYDGQFFWQRAGSGTAGNTISWTTAMTLDASGRFLIGTTTAGIGANANTLLTVGGTNATTYQSIKASGGEELILLVGAGETAIGTYSNNYLSFRTNNTERARITSGGYFKASNTGSYQGSTSGYHELRTDNNTYIAYFTNSNAAPNGTVIEYGGAAPNGTGNLFLYCGDTGGERASVRSNGGLANYSGNNVNLSDRREKTNFAPAKSYLDTICAIPVQTFNYIDQSEDDPGLTLGVVAQDVQAVAPELVMESNWGTKDEPKMRLSIYQTDLQYALMKCIQEQQALITSLTARVALLEGN